MRRIGVALVILAALGCNDEPTPASAEPQAEPVMPPALELAPEQPEADWPPPIPDGRDDGAMLTYTRTAAGIAWRVLVISTGHLWG